MSARPSGKHTLIIVVVMSLVMLGTAWRAFEFFAAQKASDAAGDALRVRDVSVTDLEAPSVRRSGELLLYEFQRDIRDGRVHGIVVDGDRLWFGTGRGLIEFDKETQARLHRQFSAAPFEWVQDMAFHDGWLAVDVLVANGSTGGHYAGNHLFDTRSGAWHALGDNVIDQVWLDDVLWARPHERMLVRTERVNGAWQTSEVDLSSKLCSEAQLAAVDGQLWIAQQGVVRFPGTARVGGPGSRVEAVPCGVLRYDPLTGRETLFDEGTGMNSGFGRDIVGDGRQVWVSHSIKADKLSIYDQQTGLWRSARPYGTANTMALSDHAVWLAKPAAREPLLRIDRETENRKPIDGVPEDFYVSAIAIDGNDVWLGLYRQNWQGTTYSIDTYLGKYTERE